MTEPKIVIVTGASRGLGRGIARQFGRRGATIYLTSRSASSDALRDAAAEVDQAGGTGIAVLIDHRSEEETAALIERVIAEQGRIDILVNNAAAVHEALSRPGAFWEKPLALAEMIEVGLRSNYTMAYFVAPEMVRRRSGLIVNISFYGASTYFHGPAYGAAKAGTDKLSFDMAVDLRPHDVACVAVWPGFIYSDALAAYAGSVSPEMLPARLREHLPNFEHPEFTGMVIDALHDDPERMTLSGQALIGAELGMRYGIADRNGRAPPSYRGIMGQPHVFVPPSPDQPMNDG